MQISSFKDSNNFKQSKPNLSLWIIRYEAVAYWLEVMIGSLGHHKTYVENTSNRVFNLYTTQSAD